MKLKPSTRLDEFLVANKHYPSRARARDAILRGCVTVDGKVSTRQAQKISSSQKVTVSDLAARYVSRASLKLVAALEETGFNPKDKIALDLGASTGGFCQVLLEAEASRVFAVDVGHDQLDRRLINHPKLTNLEGLNARELDVAHFENSSIEFITCDVSFISLKLALPKALEIAAPNAKGIFLIKPQFEVGRKAIGKNGIVSDDALALHTAEELCDWLSSNEGWRCTHFLPSPIKGGDGNREFLMAGTKDR